ncbi:hypothetical protein CDD82_4108 [Ophiocordyceps australis]|uniref:Uncharacterized protein n=1 Tax=Ophiocordyceps australis TaxID=1399860 RepID=A0A2C5Z5A2_9HYPO|nr:hypothetical protein CDD82_4108 [Ophiocordyceps australis]
MRMRSDDDGGLTMRQAAGESRPPMQVEEPSSSLRVIRDRLPGRGRLSQWPWHRNQSDGPKTPDSDHERALIRTSTNYGERPFPLVSASPYATWPIQSPSMPQLLEPAAAPNADASPLEPRPRRFTTFDDMELGQRSQQTNRGPNAMPDTNARYPEQTGREAHAKRFLCCLPRIKSKQVRSQAMTCLASGVFFLTLLAVYLGLSLSNNIHQGELNIMIVLVILTVAAFFAYSTVRLFLIIFHPEREEQRLLRRRQRAATGNHFNSNLMGPFGGYVVPAKPIPVLLARDEEADGQESTTAKTRPPAYGLWRESVRVDPNRLFWQRNEAPTRAEDRSGPRPPSYASEDGVSYVVEARPRSMAPPPSGSVSHVPSSSRMPVGRGQQQSQPGSSADV